jgi:ribonuclease H / adenosylcobalamin/alpha-ribazole phosphatase
VKPTRRLEVVVEADGGARGNPGPAGYGALVCEAATGEVLLSRSGALGVATNNVAEYNGLIAGLKAAAELGAVSVEVRMDSRLVVEQMAGRWQIRNANLRPLAAQAADLVRRFDIVRFTWVPREENTRADALANAAMDGRPEPELDLAVPKRTRAAASWAPPTAAATRIVLVRHGETEFTAQRRYSGRGDVPLSAIGLEQARAAATRIAALVPGASTVVTSPLSRCRATATEIARRLPGAVLQADPDLIECDFGEWEGLTFAEVRDGWPDAMAEWLASPSAAPPGGESFDQVAVRVRRALDRVRETTGEGAAVVVSHVTPIKLVLRDALRGGEGFLHRLYLDAAGLSLIDYWADGSVAVRLVNETAHL